MKIEVIAPCFNEADLLPFFLKHYYWVDKITFLFGMDSTDDSLKIIEDRQKYYAGPEIEIRDSTEPEGINDLDRIRNINGAFRVSDADWVIHADIDEFILIERSDFEIIPSWVNVIDPIVMQLYPHVTEDPELHIEIPVREQRRHGIVYQNHTRPVILRVGEDLNMQIGKHGIDGEAVRAKFRPIMLHWQMANVAMSLNRRCNNRGKRMSPLNLEKRWGWHETMPDLRNTLIKEFKDHENDPIVVQ